MDDACAGVCMDDSETSTPENKRKRQCDDESAEGDADAHDAAIDLLRKLLPELRPQSKASRSATDTLQLIIEQWVEDANALELERSGDAQTTHMYTPM